MKKSTIIGVCIMIHIGLLGQDMNNPESSGSMHYHHFLFTIPTGWKAAEQNGLLVLFPADLASNEMLTYIFLDPVDQSNGFESTAQALLQQIATGFKGSLMTETFSLSASFPNLSKELAGQSFKGLQYFKGYGHMKVPLPNDPFSSEVYEINIFLTRVNSRMERIVLLSKDVHEGAKESTTYRNPKYFQTTRAFCFLMNFDDWKNEPKPIGKITGTGISSAWNGLNIYVNGQSVVFSSSLQNTYLLFFDNGQVYFNARFPAFGLDELNTLLEAEWNPRLWGTYSFENNAGIIRLGNATMPFSLNGEKLSVDYMHAKHEYSRLPNVDQLVFNGTWCGSGESFVSNACIRFFPDGRFIDQGVVRALEHSLNDYYAATPSGGEGTYTIKNHSITFHYHSGTVYKTAFSGLNYTPGTNNPREIFLSSSETKYVKN